MSDEQQGLWPEFTVVAADQYNPPGTQGYVIVRQSGIEGPDGPVYCLPLEWTDHPERKGIFATREEAEQVLGGRLQ